MIAVMGTEASDISAFILAGGKSTRMGTDKAFVALDGRPLLARILETARALTSNIYIVGDPAKFGRFATVVEDVFPHCGPLGGIHAALCSSQTDLSVIVAVDLPCVSLALLQFFVTRARRFPAALVTVAHANGGLQPLCAVYRRAFAHAAENALRAGRYKIDALFEHAHTQMILQEDLETAGFSPRVFRNVNTPEELAIVRQR